MRILVIEDEHKIAHNIKSGLEHEKYAVDIAYTAALGLDLAIGEEFDLIILDRMLPGMDGIQISQKIRDANIHIPILMLTAKGQIEDRVEGLDAGADDYMVKPFAFSELFARIRALIRRPTTTADSTIVVEDLTLNITKHVVKRRDKEIRLSTKEFTLLEYLMRHAGTLLSKEQIINHVWSYDADVLPNSVEVYINRLREKIDSPFGNPMLIQTIRGYGYKIGK
jgi:DNA-binding response OmpR family regulator